MKYFLIASCGRLPCRDDLDFLVLRWPTVVPWWHTRRLRQAVLLAIGLRNLTSGVKDVHFPEIEEDGKAIGP